jgi:hypothetical protein
MLDVCLCPCGVRESGVLLCPPYVQRRRPNLKTSGIAASRISERESLYSELGEQSKPDLHEFWSLWVVGVRSK